MLMEVGDDRLSWIGKIEHQLIAVGEPPVVGKYQIQHTLPVGVGDPRSFGDGQTIVIQSADFAAIAYL